MPKEVNGKYSRNISEELQNLLENYLDDEWNDITASESPQSLVKELIKKRSGDYPKAIIREAFEAAIEKCKVG